MSEQLKTKCPICGGYIFSDDDIVYCPDCGAPHHRDCWNAIGHCGLLEDHGTEREYNPEVEQQSQSQENICENCKKPLPENAKFCPYCGKTKNKTGDPDDEEDPFEQLNAALPDPLGGVDKNEKLDGVEALHLAKFVMFMPNRLIPLFKRFSSEGKRTSWNWAAFVSPYSQAVFRKMDLAAILYLVLEAAAYVLFTPLFYAFGSNTSASFLTSVQGILNGDVVLTPQTLIFTLAGALLFIGIRVFAALFSDRLYYRHAVSTIKKIRADLDADDDEQIRKKGGVRPFISIGLFLISTYFGTLLPTLFAGLLM